MFIKPFTNFIAALTLAWAYSAAAVELPVELYGKINISYDSHDPGDDDFKSNASRIGVTGAYPLASGLSLI